MMSIALLLLGALCQTAFGGFHPPPTSQPETCTEVEGPDGGTASCHCHCTCDVDCDDGCTVGVTGQDVITGFGGGDYIMGSNNKFLTSRFAGATGSDQCKFQIRSDTEDDASGNPSMGWMGIAFGVHNKNDAKFERNFRVSLKQGVVEKRGRGIKPPMQVFGDTCIQTGDFPYPWTFCVHFRPDGCWEFDLHVEYFGCWVHVVYCEDGEGGNNSGNDQATITTSDNYNGLLEGACDDKGPNHKIDCSNADPGPGCIDGDHQYNG